MASPGLLWQYARQQAALQHHRGLVLAFEGSDVLEGDRGQLRETVHQAVSCSDLSAA